MQSKINFMIVGAARSGTTSLYNYLEQHPAIFMPAIKEPHYFSGVSTVVESFDDYLKLFDGVRNESAIGEASSSYLLVPESAQNIYQMLGKIKIIILLRNPAKRAYSNWLLAKAHKKLEKLSFEEALRKETERFLNRDLNRYWTALMYYRSGLYPEQVNRYLDLFGDENVRVYIFEEFVAAPMETCLNIFKWLDVDPSFKPKILPANTSHIPRYQRIYDFLSTPPELLMAMFNRLPMGLKKTAYEFLSSIHRTNRKPINSNKEMDPEVYTKLLQDYLPSIHKLENILQRDLSIWYSDII